MRDVFTRLGWFAAGALAVYYLDPQGGAQRRERLAGLVPGRSKPPGTERRRQRVYHHLALSDPHSDARLRDAIVQRLGRLVSHPGALYVQVENGIVRLSGDVLIQERDGLLEQVREMSGVQKLVNATTAHDRPDDLAERESRLESQPAG